MKKFINESWLVLTMGIVFAILLAGAQQALKPTIRENQARALQDAIREVVPGAVESKAIKIEGHDRSVFRCTDENGKLVGWALDAAGTGFVDNIHIVAGLDPAVKKITGIKVIENVETPGLGNKIEGEWITQYRGLDATRKVAVVKAPPKKDNNEIQAITGATWSSRYVTNIVNAIIEKIGPELENHR